MDKTAICILTRATKNELKELIQGYIDITFSNDTLYIHITSNHKFCFTYCEYDISTKLHKGISSKDIAYSCFKQYKKYIFSNFFK